MLPVNMHFEKRYSRNIQGRNQMIYISHAQDVLNKKHFSKAFLATSHTLNLLSNYEENDPKLLGIMH